MQRLTRAAFMLLIAAMLFLFFTNDFGLVDIHKTSVVVAVGIDCTEDKYSVTAQAAVPTPSQGEGSTAYTQVTGEGATVADAIDDINAKIGFYPKLVFCNLIILGESCTALNAFTVLDYFYRNDYVPLTALLAMSRGSAQELLGQKPSDGGMSSSAIQRSLSEEIRNSANSSVINLKMFAQAAGEQGKASFMPIIECTQSGSGGTTAASSGSGGYSGGTSGAKSQDESKAEFTCLKTAAFSGGEYIGELNEEQAFALNLIKSPLRRAVINAECEGYDYTVGLKNNRGYLKVSVKDGAPCLKMCFSGLANVQAQSKEQAVNGSKNTYIISDKVLTAIEDEIKSRMSSLIQFCIENDCDLLGAKALFYRRRNKDYKAFGGNILSTMSVEYDVKIKSIK